MSYTVSQVETNLDHLSTQNFHDLAELLRHVLRANPFPETSYKHFLWNEQVAVNLPILALASIELNRYATEQKIQNLLFVTRDCGHWVKLFPLMFPDKYNITYLYSSRIMFDTALKDKNPHYKQYFADACQNDFRHSLYVDVHGTGKHMLDYCLKTFKSSPGCFLVTIGADRYQDMPKECQHLWRQGRLKGLSFSITGSPIEMLNYQPMGSVIGYNEKGVVLAEPEYDINRLKPYRDARLCFQELLARAKPHKVQYSNVADTIRWLSKQIANRDKQPIVNKWITHVRKHSRVVDITTGKHVALPVKQAKKKQKEKK